VHELDCVTKFFIYVAITTQWIQQKNECVLYTAFVSYKISDEVDFGVLGR